MAGMSGIGGNIALSDAIGGVIKTWTANFTRASVDITGFGNATRNRASGIIDITGSMTGTIDGAINPLISFTGNTSPASITLTCQASDTIVFPVLIDAFTLGVAVDGEATFSANFAIASTATAFTSAVTAASWA